MAHTGPNENHLSDQIEVGGETKNVVSLDGVPIGPTWHGEFFLGADRNGRDIMVRLLYGGRNSLMIGVTAALMTVMLSMLLGIVAGYFGGWSDAGISPARHPVVVPGDPVGVALGVALALGGLKIGPISIAGDSSLSRSSSSGWSTSPTWPGRCAVRCYR